MKLTIEYEVITSFTITIERDAIPATHEALLDSVTREELTKAHMEVNEIEWGHIKEAWRSSSPDTTYVYDENNDVLFSDSNYLA